VRPASSSFQRFGERLEDRLRTNGVAYSAIRGTLEVVGTADRMMNGLAEAGRSLFKEVEEGVPELRPRRPSRSPGPRSRRRTAPAPPTSPDRIDGDG
jgi:hypothetical protein